MSDLTATQIKGALASKYGPPEWQSVCEVDEYTSAGHGCRRIDFFAVNCYASHGWHTVACEVKVSRSDWLAETRDPNKRLAWEGLASEFWFVSPAEVIREAEVPDGCGLYHVTEGLTFRTKIAARHRQIDALPLPFVAALLRRCIDRAPYLPRCVWKYEGRDLSAEEFGKCVHDACKREIEEERRSIRRQQQADENGALYRKLGIALAGEMDRGWDRVPTRDEFRAWLTERGILSGMLKSHLVQARNEINKALGEAEPATEP